MKIKLLFDRNEGKAGDILEVGKHITRPDADRLIRVNNATEVKNVSANKRVRRGKRVRRNNKP
jgi:hypothetical protein